MTLRALIIFAAALFAATPPALAFGGYRHLQLDGNTVKWGTPQVGIGATVTYAVVARPSRFPAARNCSAMVPPAALLADSGIAAATFRRELEAAFATWSRIADIIFVPAPPRHADILVGAQALPVGRAYANITYDRGTGPPQLRSLSQALICLNPEHRWKIGFDGNLKVYDLRYTLTHEIGHAIGLDHTGVDTELMGFSYHEGFAGLQAGDVAGAIMLYGPAGSGNVAGRTPPATPAVAQGTPPSPGFDAARDAAPETVIRTRAAVPAAPASSTGPRPES